MQLLSAGGLTARSITCAGVLSCLACTVEADDDNDALGVGAGTSASDAVDDGGDTAQSFDVGDGVATMAEDGGSVDLCQKIDFLFVIDSSVSMSDEQESLVTSFPGFTQTIRDATAVSDYHVMVIDTDAYASAPELEWAVCTPDPTCCANWCAGQASNPVSLCNGYPCETPPECASRFGAGRVTDAYGEACGVGEGRAFLTTAGDPLESAFDCVARVGTQGYVDEKPMEALTRALGDEMTADGECNAGFLRKDALLVVVIISDEDDDTEDAIEGCSRAHMGSHGDPADWYDAVIAAKGGLEHDVVVLSVVGPADGSCPPLDKCEGGVTGAEPAVRISDFTSRFSHGSLGSVCAPSYEDFFREAVEVVAQACFEFEPVP